MLNPAMCSSNPIFFEVKKNPETTSSTANYFYAEPASDKIPEKKLDNYLPSLI